MPPVTPPPLHGASMPLSAHPQWREATWWWLWSPEDHLLARREVVHRHGELCHVVEAHVAPGGIRVDHRSASPGGPDPSRVATTWPASTGGIAGIRRQRTDGEVLVRDLLLSAAPVAASGSAVVDGTPVDVEGWTGVRLDASGIDALDLSPAPHDRPLDALPRRLEVLLLVPTPAGAVVAVLEAPDEHRPFAGLLHRPEGGPPVSLTDIRLEWDQGTRRVRTIRFDVEGRRAGDGGPVTLRSVTALPGALVGDLGSSWPIGGWVGDDARRRRRVGAGGPPSPTSPAPGLAGVAHDHLCAVDGIAGATRAIAQVTALGPHTPSGLTGWTDPA